MCITAQLHLQNTQHKPVTFLHEHLTVAHVLHVQLCGRSTYIQCINQNSRLAQVSIGGLT